MKFTTLALCFSLLAVIGAGVIVTIQNNISEEPTGLSIRNKLTTKAPEAQKYCHGWEDGLKACFQTRDGLKLFECQNYYWVQIKKTTLTCCESYFDCARTGEFRMRSYCDPKNFICKTR